MATCSRSSLVPSSSALQRRSHASRWRADRSFCGTRWPKPTARCHSFARRPGLRNVLNGADLFSIFSAASLAPPCAGPHRRRCRSDTGERVSAGGQVVRVPWRSTRSARGSAQDQNTIHRARSTDFITFARCRKHHAQEVAGVGEVVARINKRLGR